MKLTALLAKPLWQMTGAEFMELNRHCTSTASEIVADKPTKRYVYGIDGIAELFGCSRPTALRIKQSGVIDAAINQIGRKIVVDADMALKLTGKMVKTKRKS